MMPEPLRRMLRWTSVRTRLTLWNIAVLALSLAGFAAIVHFTVKTILITAVDHDLEREAHFMTTPFPPGKVVYQPGRTKIRITTTDLLPERHPFMVIRTMDKNNHPLPWSIQTSPGMQGFIAGAVQDDRGLPPRGMPIPFDSLPNKPDLKEKDSVYHLSRMVDTEGDYHTVTQKNGQWRILTCASAAPGQKGGMIQVAYPLTDLNAVLRGLDLTLLLLIPLALMLAGIGGAFLTSRALRPVRQIAQAAAAVEATDLTRRLPQTGNDEFGELAITFNGMFGRLEKAFAQLEQAVEQQRRFTADASHELRTPLTTIKANSDWALRRNRRPEEYEEALHATLQAANRMDHTIEALLCLARSESGHWTVEPRPLRVADLFQGAVSALAISAEQATISIDIPDAALCVLGDPFSLERVVVNLLENALRHTSKEGRIILSAEERADRILLRVEDTGEGIPAAHLPYVFDRFYRVDAARARASGGAGLGLAICRSIVQAHGGSLEIRSVEGKGTAVTVSLP